MPITYTELLKLSWVPCSCCGQQTQPGGADVMTVSGHVVVWVRCRTCTGVCDHNRGTKPGTHCPIRPCKDPHLEADDPRWR